MGDAGEGADSKKSNPPALELVLVGTELERPMAGTGAAETPKKSSCCAAAGMDAVRVAGAGVLLLKKSKSPPADVPAVRPGAEDGPEAVAGPKSKPARAFEGFFGC